MTITITTDHAASHYGIPVCLIDGELVDDVVGFQTACRALGWSRADAAAATGKAVGTIDLYRYGRLPVPAEVWLVLQAALEGC